MLQGFGEATSDSIPDHLVSLIPDAFISYGRGLPSALILFQFSGWFRT
ncbi:MAG: hypothetical protein ACRD23_05525 [Terriglobales bacterium]